MCDARARRKVKKGCTNGDSYSKIPLYMNSFCSLSFQVVIPVIKLLLSLFVRPRGFSTQKSFLAGDLTYMIPYGMFVPNGLELHEEQMESNGAKPLRKIFLGSRN